MSLIDIGSLGHFARAFLGASRSDHDPLSKDRETLALLRHIQGFRERPHIGAGREGMAEPSSMHIPFQVEI